MTPIVSIMAQGSMGAATAARLVEHGVTVRTVVAGRSAASAERAKAAGMRTTIVSSDKDFGQMVEDGCIEIYDPLKRQRLRAADIEAKMGVPPKMVPHLQALWGDAVDNIIGVDGVGRDKASRLVRRFGLRRSSL